MADAAQVSSLSADFSMFEGTYSGQGKFITAYSPLSFNHVVAYSLLSIGDWIMDSGACSSSSLCNNISFSLSYLSALNYLIWILKRVY